MISQAKKEANQRNAKGSTGPRTPSGKAISSRNSRRHGLATTILRDSVWSYEVYKLAKVFISEGESSDLGDEIRTLLTAMMAVMRVQAARTELWTIALMRESLLKQDHGNVVREDKAGSPPEADGVVSDDLEGMVALEVLPQIAGFERYQRRAEAHCRRIIKDLGQIRA